MRRILAALGAVLLTFGLSTAALAAPGFATGSVNLRAGPSTGYPVVATLRAGDGLEIHGCLDGYAWCDVTWRGNRGWVSSNYIQASYGGRRVLVVEAPPPIISFSVGTYWDDYYGGRSFYRDRHRYDRDYHRRDDRYERRHHRRDYRGSNADRRQDRRDRRNGISVEERRERDCPLHRGCG